MVKLYISVGEQLVTMYFHKDELGMEEGKRISVQQTMASMSTDSFIYLINCSGGSYDQLSSS